MITYAHMLNFEFSTDTASGLEV